MLIRSDPDWWNPEWNYRRWLTIGDLPKREKGYCRWCGKKVKPPRRCWCGNECVEEFLIRSSPGHVQLAVFKRDHGICAICGVDYERVKHRHLIRQITRDAVVAFDAWGPWNYSDLYKSLWEADHIVPVIEGGGCCGLENYRTLCVVCHRAETASLAARRAKTRAQESGQPEQLIMGLEE